MHRDVRLLCVDLLLLFIGIFLSVRFWSATPFIHLGIVLLACTGIALFHSRDDISFFIGGLLLGGLGEIVATHFGVWNYAQPDLWNIPLWIPVMWGLTFMLIRRIRNTVFRLLHRHLLEKKPLPSKAFFMKIYDVGTYLLVVTLVIALWQDSLVLTGILTLLCIINLAKFHHLHDVFIVIFVGIIGVIADFYAVTFGLWAYANPTFFGQPLWVLPLYALFGLITVRTCFVFSRLQK